MKHLLSYLLLSILCLLILPSGALAAQIETGDQFVVPAGQSVAGNVYAGTGSASVLGQVVGDLYVGAGTTVVSGQVTDDLVVVGGNTMITGHIGGDVRVVGGQVVITGNVGGDVVVVGGSLSLSGVVLGDVDFIGGRLAVSDEASVGGDLTYRSDRHADISDKAVIAGAITYDKTLAEKLGLLQRAGKSDSFKSTILALFGAWLFIKLVMLLFAGLVIYWLFLSPLERVGKTTLGAAGRVLVVGFAAAVALPVLGLILLVTVVGVPLAFLLFFAYAGLLLLAKVISGPIFGAWADKTLFNRRELRFNWQTVIGGIVVLFLISYLPVIGWLVIGILSLMIFGAMLEILYKRWRA